MHEIPERDRTAVRIAADGLDRISNADVRNARSGDPRWYKHTQRLMAKLVKRGYATKIADGLYVLNAAGKAWCGLEGRR